MSPRSVQRFWDNDMQQNKALKRVASGAFLVDEPGSGAGRRFPVCTISPRQDVLGTMVRLDKGPHCSKRPKRARSFVFSLNFNVLIRYFVKVAGQRRPSSHFATAIA
ncbi:hypothetical protein FJ567_24555 [Mesorhizobium sp. B2-4-16]|nr:hypothetical protein FJ567_24555 [Mesorhizobium sp. B2-4-16]TPL60907.1 hypothetical protein FJ956_27025 [Mesorhizobium sp. B2-4-3]